jgi:hypothetical protein
MSETIDLLADLGIEAPIEFKDHLTPTIILGDSRNMSEIKCA